MHDIPQNVIKQKKKQKQKKQKQKQNKTMCLKQKWAEIHLGLQEIDLYFCLQEKMIMLHDWIIFLLRNKSIQLRICGGKNEKK